LPAALLRHAAVATEGDAMGKKDLFITKHFLLPGRRARELYHDFAKKERIVDYHCHLSPALIAANRNFNDLTEIWLQGDHYKWRAMRANGIDERLITGDASAREKFQAWAETVPRCLRNPLYHWTHLELKRPFGISDRLLCPATAESVWRECNAALATPDFTPRGILKAMRVAVVCTTDDPVDSLSDHAAIAADPGCEVQVRPTWRPDRGMAIEDPLRFNAWLDRLAEAADSEIGSFQGYLAALAKRHAYFHEHGCRLSDHGIESVHAGEATEREVARIFAKVRAGKRPGPEEVDTFKSAMLHQGALMDHRAGWVQQFHIGPLRNANTRMHRALGTDIGCDSIGDAPFARALATFLDRLDLQGCLAKTILYNIHPKDNEVLATMIGNFQAGGTPGKLQFGSGWWFLDQKDGMERQLNALSSLGLLSRFVGMLTDSRSFLSFTRHEYFRRILCSLLGQEMERGELPDDLELVGGLVRDVCYRNAASYFDFGLAAGQTPTGASGAAGGGARRAGRGRTAGA
jgi:glucuronate isomerase